jgi:hypothetical protein
VIWLDEPRIYDIKINVLRLDWKVGVARCIGGYVYGTMCMVLYREIFALP